MANGELIGNTGGTGGSRVSGWGSDHEGLSAGCSSEQGNPWWPLDGDTCPVLLPGSQGWRVDVG